PDGAGAGRAAGGAQRVEQRGVRTRPRARVEGGRSGVRGGRALERRRARGGRARGVRRRVRGLRAGPGRSCSGGPRGGVARGSPAERPKRGRGDRSAAVSPSFIALVVSVGIGVSSEEVRTVAVGFPEEQAAAVTEVLSLPLAESTPGVEWRFDPVPP